MFHRLLLCRYGSLRSPYSMHSSIAWCGVFFFVSAALFGLSGRRCILASVFATLRLVCGAGGGVSRLLSLLCARSSCSGSRRLAAPVPRGAHPSGVSHALGYRRRLCTSRGLWGFGAPLSPRYARLLVDSCPLGWLVSGGRVASSHAPPVWLVSGVAC